MHGICPARLIKNKNWQQFSEALIKLKNLRQSVRSAKMGRARKTRKFAQVKRIIGKRHIEATKLQSQEPKPSKKTGEKVTRIPQVSSSLFFTHNDALVPPYDVLVDSIYPGGGTVQAIANRCKANFLSHTVQHKLDLLPSLMDLLYAQCTVHITDCVSFGLSSSQHLK